MLCALLATLAFQDRQDVVIAAGKAYLVMPPEVVCAPRVEDADWAPGGHYILARRFDMNATPAQMGKALEGVPAPPPASSVVLWSALSRQSREIWKSPMDQAQIESMGWFATTDVAYLSVRFLRGTTGATLYRVPGSTGRLQPVATDPEGLMFLPSPVRGVGLLGRLGDPRTIGGGDVAWCVVRSNGDIGPPLKILPGAFPRHWSADGKYVYWTGARRGAAPGETVVRGGKPVVLQLDLDTSELTEVAMPRDLVQAAPPEDLRLDMARIGTEPRFARQLLLRAQVGDAAGVVITSDAGSQAALSPGLDSVFYETSQALFVRPLVKMDAKRYEEMKAAAEKAQAISNAKQCAIALLIYAADYDDVLPPAGDVTSLLQPYTKNASVLAGFVYTFGGGDMKSIGKPAETQIGYIPGPGGRAIAFADGHVQWQADR